MSHRVSEDQTQNDVSIQRHVSLGTFFGDYEAEHVFIGKSTHTIQLTAQLQKSKERDYGTGKSPLGWALGSRESLELGIIIPK